MAKNSPRGKYTGIPMGKPWNEMTKKEKLADLKEKIRKQEDYVQARGIWKNKGIINRGLYGDGSAERCLRRLKRLYKKLGGK